MVLYLLLFSLLATTVDYRQTQMNRLHYLLGIFYNDHFTNWQDGVVYFDVKAYADAQNSKNKVHVAYAYYQVGDQQRYKQYTEQLGINELAHLNRLISGQETVKLELLPGEGR